MKKGDVMTWWVLVLRVIFGILLVIAALGTGLFGYIAWKARAKKWSGGMFVITIVSILLFIQFIIPQIGFF